MRRIAVAGVVCAAVAVSGCGTDTVEGTAQGSVDGPAFSPCDDIPDGVVAGLGLDPASEERDIDGTAMPGWQVCNWQSAAHDVAVFVTPYTVADVRAKEGNVEIESIDVAGRSGISYREAADRDRERCALAFPSESGSVLVTAGFYGAERPASTQQPCLIAGEAARAILPSVPK